MSPDFVGQSLMTVVPTPSMILNKSYTGFLVTNTSGTIRFRAFLYNDGNYVSSINTASTMPTSPHVAFNANTAMVFASMIHDDSEALVEDNSILVAAPYTNFASTQSWGVYVWEPVSDTWHYIETFPGGHHIPGAAYADGWVWWIEFIKPSGTATLVKARADLSSVTVVTSPVSIGSNDWYRFHITDTDCRICENPVSGDGLVYVFPRDGSTPYSYNAGSLFRNEGDRSNPTAGLGLVDSIGRAVMAPTTEGLIAVDDGAETYTVIAEEVSALGTNPNVALNPGGTQVVWSGSRLLHRIYLNKSYSVGSIGQVDIEEIGALTPGNYPGAMLARD